MRFAFVILFLLTSFLVKGQQDTVFWFSAPEIANSEGETPIELRFLSYDSPADITISQPANGGFVPISLSIGVNSFGRVDLSSLISSIESPAADVVANTGLKITSTAKVSAFYELSNVGNKELFSLKGTKAIGLDFYTPHQEMFDNGTTTPSTSSSIEIVATENSTTVLITPRADVIGHLKDMTFSVMLNEGETFSVREADVLASTSLSGSIVSADKPIAVTIASNALANSSCNSAYGDQITNADFIGNQYVIHRSFVENESLTLLAIENSSNFTITSSSGANSYLMNWSETREFPLVDSVYYVSSNKPLYALHTSGFGCNLAGAQVAPLYCAGTYKTSFTRSTADSLGLKLVVRSGFESDFTYNGASGVINNSDFTIVPGTNGEIMSALIYLDLIQAPIDSYNLIENSNDIFDLAILSGSSTSGAAYAYFSEFTSYPFASAGNDIITCANVPVTLNGAIGGGDVTGFWGGTGFGTFENGTGSIPNTYTPSDLDTIISPVQLIITSTGNCVVQKDTLIITITPAPIVNANADQIVCENNATVVLDGSIEGGATQGEWISLGAGVFSPSNTDLNASFVPDQSDLNNGSVSLVLRSTDHGSCLAVTDTLEITFTGAPFVDAGADAIYVCSNNPDVSLSGTVSGSASTGKWSTSGSGVFDPNNLFLITEYQPSPQDITNGVITLFLESRDHGDCLKAIDSVKLIFTDNPVVDAGANIIACTNSPVVQLNGSVTGPTVTGGWSGGEGNYSVDSSDLNAIYTPSQNEINAGSFILTLESTNNSNCLAVSKNVQIDFVAPPFANFNATEVCLGNSSEFTDFSLPVFGTITDWSWDFGNSQFSSDQNEIISYSTSGLYDVQLIVTTNVGCKDTLMEMVNVYALPEADFDFSAECQGGNSIVEFNDQSTSSDPINFWYYDFGGQGSAALENPTQLFLGDGNFVISHIVNTINECADTIVKIVNIPPKPNAGFAYSSSNGLNIGAEFSFSDTSEYAVIFNWDFGDGETSNIENPDHVYFGNGTYTVTLYVENGVGCSDSTSKVITINTITQEIERLIPNAISPNGDGKNDVWKLSFIELLYPEAQINIFNKWGQEVFSSIGYSRAWDGSLNGDALPDGSYFYVIDLKDGTSEPFKGTILVLRERRND